MAAAPPRPAAEPSPCWTRSASATPRPCSACIRISSRGGMGQRVMIAAMLIAEPDLLIADEAISALDVTVGNEVLGILDRLVTQRGMGLVFISHNLTAVASFCDRVLIMYGGRIMEECAASALRDARHPYTRALLAAAPGHRSPSGTPQRRRARPRVAGMREADRAALADRRRSPVGDVPHPGRSLGRGARRLLCDLSRRKLRYRGRIGVGQVDRAAHRRGPDPAKPRHDPDRGRSPGAAAFEAAAPGDAVRFPGPLRLAASASDRGSRLARAAGDPSGRGARPRDPGRHGQRRSRRHLQVPLPRTSCPADSGSASPSREP